MAITSLIKEIKVENLAQWAFEGEQYNSVNKICHRLAVVAMATKIWDSASKNEIIIVRSTAKVLDRHRVRQNIAYLVPSRPLSRRG